MGNEEKAIQALLDYLVEAVEKRQVVYKELFGQDAV